MSSPATIGATFPIRTAEGALVPFSQVASIELDEGYSFVRRESLQRYSVLQMDVKGRDVDGFVKEAERGHQAAKVKLPQPATGSNGAVRSRISSVRWRAWP